MIKEYLGDAIDAEYDADTGRVILNSGGEEISLSPQVWKELKKFVKRRHEQTAD